MRYFLFFRKLSLTSFFINTMIDMPVCFKKSDSLFTRSFEKKHVRFANLLMTHGRKLTALGAITDGAHRFLLRWAPLLRKTNFFVNWYPLRLLSASRVLKAGRFGSTLTLTSARHLDFDNFLVGRRYHFSSEYSIKDFLFRALRQFSPLFSFFIQKTDKLRRKHGRGKVEKLRLIWKFIPPYKRFYQSLKWLFRDLRFHKAPTLGLRLSYVFETFLLTPELSFLTKIKNFIHKFVFKKYRHSLLQTLKSTP